LGEVALGADGHVQTGEHLSSEADLRGGRVGEGGRGIDVELCRHAPIAIRRVSRPDLVGVRRRMQYSKRDPPCSMYANSKLASNTYGRGTPAS
jgi:hypothetical protein